MLRSSFALALLAGVLAFAAAADRTEAAVSCLIEPAVPSFELVYSAEPGEKSVTPHTRGETATILCERLQSDDVVGQVLLLGDNRIRVVLQHVKDVQRLASQLDADGQLRFYDWEPNLIGPERAVGGHPGRAPKASALRRLEHEWKAAGRSTDRPRDLRLILAGAFPNAYGAVRLASKQKPHNHCRVCSASGPRFYLFERSPAHELIVGPVARRNELRRGREASGNDGLVLEVPVGTSIVSEVSTSSVGTPLSNAAPGWFALKDRSALNSADIVDPKQETDEFGQPSVTFGFTAKGRIAFQRVTRTIAKRGRRGAVGRVTEVEAEELSGHFAVIVDGEVKTRPIINFLQNPNGIDGRTGAQISGGFASRQEARDLAAILRLRPLPLSLTLVRQRKLAD